MRVGQSWEEGPAAVGLVAVGAGDPVEGEGRPCDYGVSRVFQA